MKKQIQNLKNRTRILVVDDHPIVRQGLALMLNQEADLTVCGEAGDAHQALEMIATLAPDLVIVDISLEDINGIELIKNIQVQDASLPVLVLSMHEESIYAERALRAGAKGYVMKQEATFAVVEAIRKILKGELYVSDHMAARIVRHFVGNSADTSADPIASLSDRELEVFQFIGKGYTTRQIAENLHLSVKTIESYRARIKEKLNLNNATELVLRAIQWVQSKEGS